jgi:hypothetical protein
MITANDARELVDEFFSSRVSTIQDAVIDASNAGCYEIDLTFQKENLDVGMLDHMLTFLSGKGYTVNKKEIKDGDTQVSFSLSWAPSNVQDELAELFNAQGEEQESTDP